MTKKVNWASSIYNIRFIPINEGNSMNKIQIKQGYIPQWRSHMRNIQIDVISAEKDFQQIKHKIMVENTDIWEVFIQSKNGLAHKHAGNVHACDKVMALENARELYTRRNEGSCIWVVKATDIVSSESEDSEAFFDPANDKMYRHPTFYTMPDEAKHI